MMKKIILSKLPPERKQKAWALIQQEAPALAEFMGSETYRLLRDKLGCSVVLTVDKGHIVTKTWEEPKPGEKKRGIRGVNRGKH